MILVALYAVYVHIIWYVFQACRHELYSYGTWLTWKVRDVINCGRHSHIELIERSLNSISRFRILHITMLCITTINSHYLHSYRYCEFLAMIHIENLDSPSVVSHGYWLLQVWRMRWSWMRQWTFHWQKCKHWWHFWQDFLTEEASLCNS